MIHDIILADCTRKLALLGNANPVFKDAIPVLSGKDKMDGLCFVHTPPIPTATSLEKMKETMDALHARTQALTQLQTAAMSLGIRTIDDIRAGRLGFYSPTDLATALSTMQKIYDIQSRSAATTRRINMGSQAVGHIL